MPIKTVHLTNAYHATSGGISTFYRALFAEANRHGRLMRLIVPADRTWVEEVGAFGRIYHLAAPRAPIFDRRYRLLLPTSYLPGLGGALMRILREERPDIIEVCDKYSLSWLAGLWRRGWMAANYRPVLIGMNCERMDDNLAAFLTRREGGRRWARYYLGNLYVPLFDCHIANSEYTAAELREAMNPGHPRDLHVLPMGAEVDAFRAATRSAASRDRLLLRAGGDENARLLLYAGRLSPEKNLSLLIDMMERLPAERYRLIVAGAGPSMKEFSEEARARVPGRVLMLGHVSNREALIELYANCDAFIHPNPREPFGIAPLEAMAAGLPLVAPRSGGVLTYANDNNAWLAAADGERIAAAVTAAFSSEAMRRQKLACAVETANQYAWPEVSRRFFDLYDALHSSFPQSRFANGWRTAESYCYRI
jgi:alpha-1,6-mannosyltransferase